MVVIVKKKESQKLQADVHSKEIKECLDKSGEVQAQEFLKKPLLFDTCKDLAHKVGRTRLCGVGAERSERL